MQMNKGAARMSGCQDGTIPNETYTVSVRLSRPTRARITEACNQCRTWCRRTLPIFLILFGIAAAFCIVGLFIIKFGCEQKPGMALESLRILDMAVYRNKTSGVPLWQVDRALNVTLSTWNPNTITKCFTTSRRLIVPVQYLNQTILQQGVPLGFGLKPGQRRPVVMGQNGNGTHFAAS